MRRLTSATMLSAFLMVAGLQLNACSSAMRYEVRGSSRAPEADGVVIATPNPSQAMTQVEVTVKHLAPPSRLAPGGNAFVCWSRRNQNAIWTRIGTLNYDEGSRAGNLTGTSPDATFEFMITIETASAPASPSANVVMTQLVGGQT